MVPAPKISQRRVFKKCLLARAENRTAISAASTCVSSTSCRLKRTCTYESRTRLESCTRDPIGYEDGWNSYRAYFVPNSVDPTGQYRLIAPSPQPRPSWWPSWLPWNTDVAPNPVDFVCPVGCAASSLNRIYNFTKTIKIHEIRANLMWKHIERLRKLGAEDSNPGIQLLLDEIQRIEDQIARLRALIEKCERRLK